MKELINKITTGDARELTKLIPDESIDLIFTDPPYHKHNAFIFNDLSIMAKRVLKQGGLLITLSGHVAFDEAFDYLNKNLDYYWISNMPNSLGCIGRYHPKQIMCGSKPMLWFSKGDVQEHSYVFDTFPSKRDKQYHIWGQPLGWFIYYIEKLTTIGGIIFDPYVGGGTVAAACKITGRNYIAFEIDPETAELARERVLDTQPPLFILEPEQLEFDGYDKSPYVK